MPIFIHIDGQQVPRGERGGEASFFKSTRQLKCNVIFIGPNVLILSPTRELALQIHDEVKKYEYRGIKR